MGNLSAIKINDGLIRINERNEQGLNVDAWLVLGNEKAVLIDAVSWLSPKMFSLPMRSESLYPVLKTPSGMFLQHRM